MDKRLIGILGEKLVCKWYTDKKYELLDINYKTRFGEVDIIAKKKNLVVFIEVKTRKDNKFTNAREAVTYSKQQRIKSAAKQFLAIKNLGLSDHRCTVFKLGLQLNIRRGHRKNPSGDCQDLTHSAHGHIKGI